MAERATMKMVVRISTPGAAQRFRRNFNTNQIEIQREIQQGLHEAAKVAVEILKTFAPEDTGRLKRAIGILGGRLTVTGTARRPLTRVGVSELDPDPRIGLEGGAVSNRQFRYLDVTRRGRKAVSPKRKSKPSRKLGTRAMTENGRPTGEFLPRFSAAALQFPGETGALIYRRRVPAWRPASDWVKDAEPSLRAAADAKMRLTGRRIGGRLRGNRGGASVRVF